MPRDSLFVIANGIEAGLWFVVGAGFLLHVLRHGPCRSRYAALAAMTFLAFGFSDLVELRTGAWWQPWWLLAWKGTCLAVLVWLLTTWVRTRRATAA